MSENKKVQIEFAPGCFDAFEGTQEELDQLIAEIQQMFDSGEAQKKARPIDFDNPSKDDLEIIDHLLQLEDDENIRKLQ